MDTETENCVEIDMLINIMQSMGTFCERLSVNNELTAIQCRSLSSWLDRLGFLAKSASEYIKQRDVLCLAEDYVSKTLEIEESVKEALDEEKE